MNLISTNYSFRFYGRRKGRKLSKLCLQSIKKANKFIINYDNILDIFIKPKKKIILEIGFGNGENIINCAKINPDILYLGADPFYNTTVKCLKQILENNLKNIRIWPDDVRKIINIFPPNSLSEIKLLFPDPWPKSKHKNRRLIQENFLESIGIILKKRGIITIGTDHKILKSWVLEKFMSNSNFEWVIKDSKDWQTRPSDCFETKYENKAYSENRKPSWFIFKKI